MRSQKTIRGRRAAKRPPRRKKPRVTRCETTGKRSFASKGDAVGALSRFSHYIMAQRAYECEFCGAWHVTSQAARS